MDLPLAIALPHGRSLLLARPWPASIFGLDSGYPGPAPGLAEVVCRKGEIALRKSSHWA